MNNNKFFIRRLVLSDIGLLEIVRQLPLLILSFVAELNLPRLGPARKLVLFTAVG